MEQHPIPRQITTFEFKLIGFLTIKQFIYLAVFIPAGILMYLIFPIPLLNILLAVIVGGVGAALAFVPINDRPMDIWIRNFFKRLTSPTQYQYHKNNKPLYFLQNLLFVSDPHRVMAHIESQEKLSQYLAKTSPRSFGTKKQDISMLFHLPTSSLAPQKKTGTKPGPGVGASVQNLKPPATQDSAAQPAKPKGPFFTGIVKNHKLIPLSGIMIYVKDDKGSVLRLLKTNPHGVFATFSPLPKGEYSFEIKDPNNNYFFDTIKIKVEDINQKPLEFYSKELL